MDGALVVPLDLLADRAGAVGGLVLDEMPEPAKVDRDVRVAVLPRSTRCRSCSGAQVRTLDVSALGLVVVLSNPGVGADRREGPGLGSWRPIYRFEGKRTTVSRESEWWIEWRQPKGSEHLVA